MTRLIQITDLHIGQPGENTFGVDVRANFLNVLKEAARLKPDALILTGDLCFDKGDAYIYKWIHQQLTLAGIPFEVIPGNHDDIPAMAAVFEKKHHLKKDELYFTWQAGGSEMIFLDTSAGTVSSPQLKWLKQKLLEKKGDFFLFMHHPPILCGVPYMDHKYALQNRDDLQEILFAHNSSVHVYCGHYHVERTLYLNNLIVNITPSTFFQIDMHSTPFRVDHYRTAFRVIEWEGSGLLRQNLHYFDGIASELDA